MTIAAPDALFARLRLPHALDATIANLPGIPSKVSATRLQQPLQGRPAFVVGAGPSLSRNGHLLAQAQECGPIICVNSSAQAVVRHGVQPDVLVVREMTEIARHLEGVDPTWLVADVQAHPAIFAQATHWFASAHIRHVELARSLRSPLVYAGTAALTSAVMLARMWGADPIVLVGCDLAFGPKGEGYAAGTPWETLRADVEGNRAQL